MMPLPSRVFVTRHYRADGEAYLRVTLRYSVVGRGTSSSDCRQRPSSAGRVCAASCGVALARRIDAFSARIIIDATGIATITHPI